MNSHHSSPLQSYATTNDQAKNSILIVDDTLDNLSMLGAILKDYYTAKVANNGEKALRICRSETPPDLILLDILMPGMDGYEVCRRLKSDPATRNIPVIFLTARTDTADEKLGFDLGAVDYITKPISPPIVLARIKTQLTLKASADFLRDQNAFLEQEVKKRTVEVWEAYQLNRAIISNAQEGIVVYDSELRCIVWNPFMKKLYGIPATEAIGRHPLEIFPVQKENGAMRQLERALAGETLQGCEFTQKILSSGKTCWTFESAAPLRDASGAIVGVISTVSDLTEQKNMEKQLRHSQKLEGIGQIAGGIAHDFNNLLTVILGYGNILDMDKVLGQEYRHSVKQIINAAQSAAQLTKGLLAFSRKQEMLIKLADLNDIVQHFEKFLVRIIGEDIKINMLLSKMILPVLADSGQIEQILLNLATNARDAMPKGGQLSIETGVQEIDTSLQHIDGFCESGRYAWLSVSDSGCGMSPDTREKLFDPFFTTKDPGKGTGLGMSIVYGIVSQHNGIIHVDSEPGVGSTFKIYLPIIDTERIPKKNITDDAPPARGTETILLAEDNLNVRQLVESLLAKYGYSVIQAKDGEDAVDKFQQNCDVIKLVIMDMIMPNKSGTEAYEEIRRIKPGIRVLFLSGYTSDFLTHHGIKEDGLEVISKPLHPLEFLRKIRQILD